MSGEFEMRSDRTSNDGKYRIWTCASAHGCGATAVSGLFSAQLTLIVPHNHVTGTKKIPVRTSLMNDERSKNRSRKKCARRKESQFGRDEFE